MTMLATMTQTEPAGKAASKALGPYAHGNRWRVIVVSCDGTRSTESFPTREAAEERATEVNARNGIAVSEAVDKYIKTLRDRSRETAKHRLFGLLRVVKHDRPLATITPAVARDLYKDRVEAGYAGATLHGEVGYAQRFFAWALGAGLVRANPFAEIEVTKERNRGKPKLRVNASKQFLAHLWQDTSIESTAVLTTFVLALRASAVVNRTVGDLDDDGRLLWIRDDKTPSGDREIEIPELLRQRLLPLAEGKAPTDRLFGDVTRNWLHYHTVRLCKKAGVPRVTPQGLRGSGATSAVRMGDPLSDVARALGHADGGRTLQRHYLGGGAIESARGRQAERLLAESIGDAARPPQLKQEDDDEREP